MSNRKKEQIIRVDNLVIHAKNVEIINEGRDHAHDMEEHANEMGNHADEIRDHEQDRRDPWGFFWGRQQANNVGDQGEFMDVGVENNEGHHHN